MSQIASPAVYPNPARQAGIGLALVALLIGVYFLTFNGFAISSDEWFLFDATESLARRGNLRMNYLYDVQSPQLLAQVAPPVADTEPLQPLLAVPLFRLAEVLPGIGLAHTVWLFNVLITALTAGALYAYGLALDYRPRAAAIVALLFGLGTVAWPYSRTFFREPLFSLLALLSALLTLRLRQALGQGERPLGLALALIVAFAGALFSKEAAFLMVPALAVQAFPDRLARRRYPRRTLAVLLGLAVAVAALVLVAIYAGALFGVDTRRWAAANRLAQARANLAQMGEGVFGYLFSPGRGVWVYSPVLLAGFFGWPRLIRARNWREIAVPLAMLLAFVFGYAVVRGEEWYGGTGWGPRYLVPVTPFLALWLLPVVERLLEAGASRIARAALATLAALSVGMQALGVLVPVHAYYDALARQTPPIIPWQEGAWSLRWSPPVVSLDLLGEQTPDLLAARAVGRAWLLPALAGLLMLLALLALAWWLRRRGGTPRAALITGAGLALATALVLGGGLAAARRDPRYHTEFAPLQNLLAQLEPQLQPDDALVLSDNTYRRFFMNSYKQRAPMALVLPYSPGKRTSPEAIPQVVSNDPDALIHPSDALILADLARRHDRLWLIEDSSPFVSWANRPVEQYLARHTFPVREVSGGDLARAVLFDLTPAAPPSAPLWPEQRIEARFGASLSLIGADLPAGNTVRRGGTLPVTLLWQAVEPIAPDYSVALLLIGPDGAVVAQRDSFPAGGFEPTSSWRAGSLHRDNHGLPVPPDAPPGAYELWVVVYDWRTPGDRLPVTRTGLDAEASDHALLGAIRVE
ncbi:MAG TPA: hypothetical protein PKD46_04520 [Aggregatilineaceae bacterium]|nr:hypothetical protein [Aggregatilineaceae bacterium]